MRRVPASPHPERTYCPSGENVAARTASERRSKERTMSPESTFQSWTWPFELSDTRYDPSGDRATEIGWLSRPVKVWIWRPVTTSHSLTLLSVAPDSAYWPSGENETALTQSALPSSERTMCRRWRCVLSPVWARAEASVGASAVAVSVEVAVAGSGADSSPGRYTCVLGDSSGTPLLDGSSPPALPPSGTGTISPGSCAFRASASACPVWYRSSASFMRSLAMICSSQSGTELLCALGGV